MKNTLSVSINAKVASPPRMAPGDSGFAFDGQSTQGNGWEPVEWVIGSDVTTVGILSIPITRHIWHAPYPLLRSHTKKQTYQFEIKQAWLGTVFTSGRVWDACKKAEKNWSACSTCFTGSEWNPIRIEPKASHPCQRAGRW